MPVYKNKRSGRWVAQAYDAAAGKNIQLGTRDTKREAKALLVAYEEQLEAGVRPMTVAQWRDRWLEIKAGGWRASTLAHNEERTRRFVEAHGERLLTEFNLGLARQWAREYPSTVGAVSAMFGAAIGEADADGNALLVANPFSRAVKKKTYRRDLADEWLTAADVDHLCNVAAGMFGAYGHDAARIVRFAAETGIRPGELFMVEEADLNPADGELIIRRAAGSKTRTIGPPKNGESRTVVLSAVAAEAAATASRFHSGLNPVCLDARGRELPWSTKGTPRVFSSARGLQLWVGSWGHYWRQIAAAAGRPGMDFYELRHYCATRLLEAGVRDDQVAVQLGHTDGGELVRQVYGRPSQRRARAAVRAALDGEAA